MQHSASAVRWPTTKGDSALGTSWSTLVSFASRILGFSAFSLFSGSSVFNIRLLIMGALIEVGRRLIQWALMRFKFRMSVSAQFTEGDPVYDWILLFLTEESAVHTARDFQVTAKSSKRQLGVQLSRRKTGTEGASRRLVHAEYVPDQSIPQIFHWKGYWLETSQSETGNSGPGSHPMGFDRRGSSSHIRLTVYTRNVEVLSDIVESARLRYLEKNRPHVIVRGPVYGMPTELFWSQVVRKARRTLDSIVLQDDTLEMLLRDAREFIAMEEWYADVGIPHRRGYLLYGPPGTGKSSTIHALAGELGMEIYTLSLAARFVDDSTLQTASSLIPKNSIFLIEDIDCAFPPRGGDDDDEGPKISKGGSTTRSMVTLSGLLNVLDGVGSEEGKLFFATTNYADRLDSALLRPGRIDVKVEYKLSSTEQAAALFVRFYPAKHLTLQMLERDQVDVSHFSDVLSMDVLEKETKLEEKIKAMSELFAASIPENEFSTAELQGYLLGYKKQPLLAVHDVGEWIRKERKGKEDRDKNTVPSTNTSYNILGMDASLIGLDILDFRSA